MLMEWKNSQNLQAIPLKVIFQVQCNSYQNSNGIFHRNRKKNPKSCMEPQKTEQPKQS